MAARDTFHHAVRSALEKDDWRITHDPLYINFSGSSGLSLQNHLQKREQTLISRGIRVIFGNLRYRILAQQHVS